jgi:hypothetical protein
MKKSCFLPSPPVTRCENWGRKMTIPRLTWLICAAELAAPPVLLLAWWLS